VTLQTAPLTADAIAAADCVAILTEHRCVDYDMVRDAAQLVVDTRNAIAGEHPHVLKLGAPAPAVVRPNTRDRVDASDAGAPVGVANRAPGNAVA